MVEQAVAKYEGENIVFIVGSQRSGTTWLQRLLASHPQVRTGQESYLFSYIAPQLRAWKSNLETISGGRGGVGLPCYFSDDEFRGLLLDYTRNLLEPMIGDLSPSELFVEKTPDHALFLPEIATLLPRSRIIHILRDPRDVVASLLAASKTWGNRWAPENARRAAWMWVRRVRPVRDVARMLPRDRFLEIRYEDLRQSPAQNLAFVSRFLGLEWEGDQLAQAVSENSVENSRKCGGTPIPVKGEFSAVSGPVVTEPNGFVRRAQPGGWKDDLSSWEKFQVWWIARKLMVEVGYPWLLPR